MQRLYVIVRVFLLFSFAVLSASAVPSDSSVSEKTYYVLGVEHGLRGRHVLQMLQLADGRMVVATESHINIYDGCSFSAIPIDTAATESLGGYDGHTHLYVDAVQRLWIKERRRVSCLDLKTLRYIRGCIAIAAAELSGHSVKTSKVAASAKTDISAKDISDLFVDSGGGMWIVSDGSATGGQCSVFGGGCRLDLPLGSGVVQDIDVSAGNVVVFTSCGLACVFRLSDGSLTGVSSAYSDDEASGYSATSLIVKSAAGMFRQIRTGRGGSVFQSFSLPRMSWQRHFVCPYMLHTLVASGSTAYITTPDGYITYDISTARRNDRGSLRLPDGTRLATGINTVCLDREGAVWLGTYGSGLLYLSPLSGVFDMRETDIRLTPVVTAVNLHGRPIAPGDGHGSVMAPYIDSLTLSHSDNDISFTLSSMKFVRPRSVCWRYRLVGLDEEWHVADADTPTTSAVGHSASVDGLGQLTLSYVNLPSGSYKLEVMASQRAGVWTGGVRRLMFTVGVPWWRSAAAIIIYIIMCVTLGAFGVWLYVCGVKRRMVQQAREEMLLMRIRDLMDRCSRLDGAVNVVLADTDEPEDKPQMNAAELDFLNRATQFVEQHINDSAYTVEQLSRDLCMERTGLYRRLTAILDKSPQMFIRSIRLRRAAQLLASGGMTVSEVSDATGFSSPSYFTKCFQKEFGCRPTEYEAE